MVNTMHTRSSRHKPPSSRRPQREEGASETGSRAHGESLPVEVLQRAAGNQVLQHLLLRLRPGRGSGASEAHSPLSILQREVAEGNPGSALSEAIPASERRRLRVVTAPVVIQALHDLFSTEGGTTTRPLPEGVAARYGAGIEPSLQRGLSNVAGTMTGHMTPPPLEVNSTVTLSLDLTPYGGQNAAYRFTYVEHGRAREILIEMVGAISAAAPTEAQAQADELKFSGHGFRRGPGWSADERRTLLAAVARVPDAILTPVDGLIFRRDGAHPEEPNRGGDYDAEDHAITMYDVAFSASQVRYGAPDGGLADDAMRSIIHEIGHAADLLPLRRVWAQLQQAQDALLEAFREYESPPGSGEYQFPDTEQARWTSLNARVTAAQQARNQERSRSGHRWQAGEEGNYVIVEGGSGAAGSAFRAAAQQDGAVRITHYSDEEWQEYYAESFSLYITDPQTLRRLRQHVYDYFVAHPPQ